MAEQRWFYPRGTLSAPGWETVVDTSIDGWAHTGLRIAPLSHHPLLLDQPAQEKLVVPLSGSVTVEAQEDGTSHTYILQGRQSVFHGPTDVLYLSSAATAVLTGTGRVAVATSPTSQARPTRIVAAADIPVEIRGAGACTRQVHNFGTPETLDAARFIVCEVITPAQNWSSYPPHKHDQHNPGHESQLEEIYYFESAPTRIGGRADNADAAFGMFSTYSSPAGQIDINAQVKTGDIALVPYGYHGPAVAAPGYDLYYLNVMAGPDSERSWRISDDPSHTWIRDQWTTQRPDPRLPYLNSEPTA